MCAGLVSSTYSIPSTTFIVATPLVSSGWALLRAHAAGCSALRYRPRGSPSTMSMYFASYDGSNKKVFWQEMWRHELEEALRHDPVVIVPVGAWSSMARTAHRTWTSPSRFTWRWQRRRR